ncbi:hypothetical protein DFP72DRAFT_1044385 [Ephemerocybe angulata]|uniref:Uncharacterized protein n=1 Tax=Ephemerocybe angulata TaxID=980116 RepID=A0A8H6M7D0_9AGAR|nr:hypothetical protein DFP72DRAFT_1044385 [Tulosesus angulatus]
MSFWTLKVCQLGLVTLKVVLTKQIYDRPPASDPQAIISLAMQHPMRKPFPHLPQSYAYSGFINYRRGDWSLEKVGKGGLISPANLQLTSRTAQCDRILNISSIPPHWVRVLNPGEVLLGVPLEGYCIEAMVQTAVRLWVNFRIPNKLRYPWFVPEFARHYPERAVYRVYVYQGTPKNQMKALKTRQNASSLCRTYVDEAGVKGERVGGRAAGGIWAGWRVKLLKTAPSVVRDSERGTYVMPSGNQTASSRLTDGAASIDGLPPCDGYGLWHT